MVLRKNPVLIELPLIALLLSPAAWALSEEESEKVVGPLDEGKTYRVVDGHAITGKEIADLMVEQRWEKERGAFVEHILVADDMQQKGVSVSEKEIKEELQRMATTFARKNAIDPKLFSLDRLARHLKYSLDFLNAQTRTALGLRKILVKEGLLKAEVSLQHPKARETMQTYLKKMAKSQGVVWEAEKLGKNEAVRVGGRGFSRAQVRKFILDGVGPLLKTDLMHALELLTLEHLLAKALARFKLKSVDDKDRAFHFSYMARLREYADGDPDGRQSILFSLRQKGMTVRSFLKERSISFDAGITCLARQAVREPQIKSEWEKNPKAYQSKDKMLAHIFVRVRDPEGRAYTPAWEAKGHTKVNEYVKKVREERFAEEKPRIERMIGAARGDFARAAAKLSDDEGTKQSGGLIGRVGPHSVFPTLPIDKNLIREALKLEAGQVSDPIRSAFGWHLVRCLEKEKQATKYEEAREHIYVILLKRKRKELMDGFMEGVKIDDKF